MKDMEQKALKDFAPIPVRALLDKDLGCAALRVLGIITACVGKDGTCYPSQRKMANTLGVSQQAIAQHVRRLRECGYIEVRSRTSPEHGGPTSNLYKVIYGQQADIVRPQEEVGEDTSSPCEDTSPARGGSQAPELVGVTSSGTCTNIPINKPMNNKPKNSPPGYSETFNIFWRSFPSFPNPNKPDAFGEWQNLMDEGIEPEILMKALDIHRPQAEQTEMKFRKRAHTWLKDRIWEGLLEQKPEAPRITPLGIGG